MRVRAYVFDDDEAVRLMLWHILDNRGYEIFTFPDAGLCPFHTAAVCPCPKNQSCGDIIISDINMPNISGLEFVKDQIKKGCRIKNIALMSGSWSKSELQEAKKLGCQLFNKPFNISDINEWLDECEKDINPKRTLSDWFQQNANNSNAGEFA